MCEYCKQSENGGVTLAEQQYADLGKLGEVQLEIVFRNFAPDAKQGRPPQLTAAAWYAYDPDNGRTLVEGRVEVAYCPFCGRKLRGSEEEQTELVKIKDVTPGTTVEIGGIEMDVLGIGYPAEKVDENEDEVGVFCLAHNVQFRKAFDNDNGNNWEFSSLREYLNGDYLNCLPLELQEDLLPFHRDLISEDGWTNYGFCTDVVSLISCDEYRTHRVRIGNYKEYPWWTLTPHSVSWSDLSTPVQCVAINGTLGYQYACYKDYGVAPVFLIRNSVMARIVGGNGKKEQEVER